ncbi:hypothetical protein [Methanosalsum natronophilum]|uniref:hypothetical protein n=1 Tax=Methanosalsum natronophilum TaxID=768733 RepID=UPI002167EB20|nr:hypothetical protein [Methanosalsum natronophilum]MCS3923611.1 hypothetical protein [Methanosalsum natronophilum]
MVVRCQLKDSLSGTTPVIGILFLAVIVIGLSFVVVNALMSIDTPEEHYQRFLDQIHNLESENDVQDTVVENLFSNSAFDDWEASVEWGSSAKLTNKSENGNSVIQDNSSSGGYLRQKFYDFDSDKDYRVSFYAKKEGTINDVNTRALLYEDGNNFTVAYSDNFTSELTDEWQLFEYEITYIPEDTEYIRVEIYRGLEVEEGYIFVHSPKLKEI